MSLNVYTNIIHIYSHQYVHLYDAVEYIHMAIS